MTGIEKFIYLDTLNCCVNQLSSLDVSNNIALITLICSFNNLHVLDVSSNTALSVLYLGNIPSLEEVCVWTMPFPPANFTLCMDGSPSVYFTTQCSHGS
jgi:Leucine-rich repeat (LRR) protein